MIDACRARPRRTKLCSYEGRFYTFHDALTAPRPIQACLPILVGGSGPRKPLRSVALQADASNTAGWLAEVRAQMANLERHCVEVGRDPRESERTLSFPIVIRDSRRAAEAAFATLVAHNRASKAGEVV